MVVDYIPVVSSSQVPQKFHMISPINGGNTNIQSATPVTKMELSIAIARNAINSSRSYHPTLNSGRVLFRCL
jgi:hypothetical protein